ncbi:MAG: hypothetical protein HFH39_04275 [Lachnospiraceae bacterium]|jgi:hypothetical protein|nr:hypothetical protein [Lachnospiraceae bacterium]MCI9646252.1 hypothetical protein [Lachnospiraceae bacterium]
MKKRKLEQYFKLKQYFRKLKKCLRHTYSSEQVATIIKQLQNSSDNYFLENPNASFEDFIEEFGDFENLSLNFIENAEDLSKLTDTAHFRKKLIIIILVIAIFLGLFSHILDLAVLIEEENTTITQEELTIY